MSSGRPPTLWWLLMTAACAVPLSITSGYSVPWTRKVASTRPPVCSSKMRTNSSPMILRLSSGSVMPRRRSKKRSPASTWMSSMPRWRRNVSTTCADSPSRISPVSTYTQVSWGPMARWTSAAATAESTPPDRPQMARRVTDLGPHGLDLRLDDRRHGPRRAAAAHVEQEPGRAAPGRPGVWTTSGWNWTPWIRRPACSSAATATSAVRAVATKPSGARTIESKWLIHTGRTGWSGSSRTLASPVTVSSVRPYSPRPVWATSPPSCWATSWAP